MFPEESQQGKRFQPDTHYGVLHQFRRDESQAVLNPVVMSGNLLRQFVYGTVHCHRIRTASVGKAFFRIPDVGIDGYLRANLFPFGIDAHLTQQLARPVLAHLGTVDIEQYRECAAMSDSIVCMFTFLFHVVGFLSFVK